MSKLFFDYVYRIYLYNDIASKLTIGKYNFAKQNITAIAIHCRRQYNCRSTGRRGRRPLRFHPILDAKLSIITSTAYIIAKHYKNNYCNRNPEKPLHTPPPRLFSINIVLCCFYSNINYNEPHKKSKKHNLHLLIFVCFYNTIYIISARYCYVKHFKQHSAKMQA